MNTGFEIVDGLTSADIAVRICAHSIEELLATAAFAMLKILLANPEEFNPELKQRIDIEAESMEMLLYRFLDELVFLKDARKLLALFDGGTIEHSVEGYALRGVIAVDSIDAARHRFNVDIKAVTLHGLSCRKQPDGYIAQVVFDV